MPKIVKVKRTNTAGDTPVVSYGELAYNAADNKLYVGNAANQPVLVNTPSSGGGTVVVGGSASVNYAYATTADLPATGDAALLYCTTDTGRLWRWVSSGSVWAEVGPLGGGGGSGQDAELRSYLVPGAPTNVAGTAGNAQVALTWTAPTTVVAITDYVVQHSTNNGSTWTTFSDGTSASASAVVTGLTNGTAYTFRVAAVSGIGQGAWSTASEAVTPGDVFRAIPAMTGYTSPSGEVSGNHNQNPADATLWRAFDGRTDLSISIGNIAQLIRAGSNNPARSIQYAFPEGQKSRISGYSITTAYTNLDQWKLFGSDDLSNWTLLDSRSGISAWGTPQQTRTFSLSQPATYRAFRWVLQDVSDLGDNILIAEISLIA